MRFPVDIGKLKKTAISIQDELDTNLGVTVYLDKTANVEFYNSMLCMFEDYNIKYIKFVEISKENIKNLNLSNLSIVICGNNSKLSRLINKLIEKDIPTILISINPENIFDIYNENKGNKDLHIICPKYDSYTLDCVDDNVVINFSVYNKSMYNSIKRQFYCVISKLSVVSKISYACIFPFLRSNYADHVINTCSLQNAGIGALLILPGADMPLMTLNQARMILELAAIYGYDINQDRILEIVVLVISAFGLRYMADKVQTKSKFSKLISNSAFGAAGTKTLGHIAKNYFKSNMSLDALADFINNKTGNISSKLLLGK